MNTNPLRQVGVTNGVFKQHFERQTCSAVLPKPNQALTVGLLASFVSVLVGFIPCPIHAIPRDNLELSRIR